MEAVQRAAEADAVTSRPTLATPLVEPRTPLQSKLAALWAHLLHVDRVGIDDEFESLGGASLTAAYLFAEIERRFGIHLPMTTILEAPTVELLALRIESGARASLKLLKPGAEGGPALFLVHDGDGETLLYANLARRLPEEIAVYGLEPYGTGECPLLHTSIPAMAGYYVEQVRQAQPRGPVFLGGMCRRRRDCIRDGPAAAGRRKARRLRRPARLGRPTRRTPGWPDHRPAAGTIPAGDARAAERLAAGPPGAAGGQGPQPGGLRDGRLGQAAHG